MLYLEPTKDRDSIGNNLVQKTEEGYIFLKEISPNSRDGMRGTFSEGQSKYNKTADGNFWF